MLSFQRGLEQGAEMFELDVRLSKDGVPVIMHDNQLRRLTGRCGSVSQRTWKHLSKLDVGSWKDPAFADQRLLRLEDVLAFLAPHVPINVEMKYSGGEPSALANTVAKVIKDLGLTRRILVSSFRHDSLPIIRKCLPELLTAPLFEANQGPLGQAQLDLLSQQPLRSAPSQDGDFPCAGRIMCLHHSLATEEFVRSVNALGGGIFVWTVNEPEDMLRLASYGVKGIISNWPGRLKEVLEGAEK